MSEAAESLRLAARQEVLQAMTPYRLELDAVARKVEKLDQLLRGDESLGLPGLLSRLDTMESRINQLLQMEEARERRERELKARMSGLVIGLGLTGLTGAGTLIAVLRLLIGGTP